ncbi:MAG: GNAT family N-acetyltransferase [Chthoniobacterales bacterium]
MTVLETPRLTLRKFTPSHLDRLAELMRDAGFMRFSGSKVFTRDQAAASLERILAAERAGRPSQFAVILREGGQLIGYCGFFVQTVDGIEEVEIGYRLDPTHWGCGLASEAAQAVRDHAFRDLELPHVISLIHPDNRLHPRRRKERHDTTTPDGLARFSDNYFSGGSSLKLHARSRKVQLVQQLRLPSFLGSRWTSSNAREFRGLRDNRVQRSTRKNIGTVHITFNKGKQLWEKLHQV